VSNECPKCQTNNPDTSSYCADCGTQLGSSKDIPAFTKTLETPFPQFEKGKSLADRYEIIEELGKGGMGEVYLAEDTNLKRQVAIKVLPKPFSLDPERLARFEREARLLASLNHPKIATIFGLEKSDGQQFLVMELVEGETLRERISKDPLPVEEALETCLQIAEGLESAHEKGIIHRDLKPANIKVTREGKVKILDFGIAKAFQDKADGSELSEPLAKTDEMTEPGVILGTAAYMSPEQAKGKAVDKRTDIWAFGCLLYECITGMRPFHGQTSSETLASILKDEPDWKALPADTPFPMRLLLKRCLRKDTHERLQHIGDARIEINEMLNEPSVSESKPAVVVTLFSHKVILLILAAVVTVAMITAILVWNFKPDPSIEMVRTLINVPNEQILAGMNYYGKPTRTVMSFSPDGKHVVYGARNESTESDDEIKLYLRALDKSEAIPIPGTEGGVSPFFSADGQWIGFWSGEKLKKVKLSGGTPITICNVPYIYGASWGSSGTIIFAHEEGGLWKISSTGGTPEALTTADLLEGEYSHRLPHILPGERAVIFTVVPYYFGVKARIESFSLESGERKILIEDGADSRYTPTGHLVYVRKGSLMAVPFDPVKLELKGSEVTIIEGIIQSLNARFGGWNSGAGQFSFSNTGSLLYIEGGIYPEPKYSLVWFDRKGSSQPLTKEKGDYYAPRISPDGQRVAYYTVGSERNIWVYDISRNTSSILTFEGQASRVIWTPDGKKLTFGYAKFGPENIYMQPLDGSGPMERLTTSEYSQRPQSWSPDGKYLAFVEYHPLEGTNIWILQMEDRQLLPFLKTEFSESCAEFSPDGKWLAYFSNESGRDEVYVRPFPGSGGKIIISTNGGSGPIWALDGGELFYTLGDNLMSVKVTTEPEFQADKPQLLFEAEDMFITGLRNFDISLVDLRFLMQEIDSLESTTVKQMHLVLNWFKELKSLVPSGK